MTPMQEPTLAQRRRLEKVRARTETLIEADRVLTHATNALWDSMREARKAGASLEQIRQATKWTMQVFGDEMGPLYSRARVQQLTQGYAPKEKK